MEAPALSIDQKKQLIESIKVGTELPSIREPINQIKEKLQSFVKTGDSNSIFLSGTPGSGKTYAVQKALNESLPEDMWRVVIDCRIFDTDKSCCREFLRQTNNLATTPVLEVLNEKGSGVIVFDHFDALKIIKRQFFLYTIFDSIHTNTISLCSIIITSSVEPLSNLEKRVRSRLTPQYVDIPAPTISIAKVWISSVLLFKEPKSDEEEQWNAYVKKFFERKGEKQLDGLFSLSPTLHTASCFGQKFVLSNEHKTIQKEFNESLSADRFLGALSQTELILMFIAAFMIDLKSINEFTFDELFKEITEQSKQRGFIRRLRKSQALLAWEKLTSLNFLIPTSKDKTHYTLSLFSEDLYASIDNMPTDMQMWIRTWLKK